MKSIDVVEIRAFFFQPPTVMALRRRITGVGPVVPDEVEPKIRTVEVLPKFLRDFRVERQTGHMSGFEGARDEVRFADASGLVSLLAEQDGKGVAFHRWGGLHADLVSAMAGRVETGQHGDPARGADGGGYVGLIETDTALGELIEMWGVVAGAAEEAESVPTLLISGDEEEVGAGGSRHRGHCA